MSAALLAEITKLRVENEELRAQLKVARAAAKPERTRFPATWKLRPQEMRTLALLVDSGFVSFERFSLAIYGQPFDESRRPSICTSVYRARRKLGDLVEVQNIYGEGFVMDDASRARVRACEGA